MALLGEVELQFDHLSQTDGGRRLRLDESSWERGSQRTPVLFNRPSLRCQKGKGAA